MCWLWMIWRFAGSYILYNMHGKTKLWEQLKDPQWLLVLPVTVSDVVLGVKD